MLWAFVFSKSIIGLLVWNWLVFPEEVKYREWSAKVEVEVEVEVKADFLKLKLIWN